jgi:acetyl esterase/lipase
LPIIRFMQEHIPLSLANDLLKSGLARTRLPADIMHQSLSADGVPCQWVIPQNSPPERVLLYLHGGGFVFGLTPPHLHMAARLAQNLGMRILMVDYRLAPQHPFPAALDDCVTAYRWLLAQGISPRNTLVAGDSAGGNLTVTLLMKLRDSGSPLPAAAACLSPVTDFTNKDTHSQAYQDPLLPAKAIELYTRSYLGESDACQPLISPVYGDLRGLPPLLVHAGEDEILREDAVRLVRQAQSAGVEAQLEVFPRMWHVWQLNLALPQALQSLEEIAGFFKASLERAAV